MLSQAGRAKMELQALLTSNAGSPFLSRRILLETEHFREGGSSGLQIDSMCTCVERAEYRGDLRT